MVKSGQGSMEVPQVHGWQLLRPPPPGRVTERAPLGGSRPRPPWGGTGWGPAYLHGDGQQARHGHDHSERLIVAEADGPG